MHQRIVCAYGTNPWDNADSEATVTESWHQMSPCDVSVSFVCVFFCLFFFHTSLSTISPAYLQKFLFQRGKLPYSYTRHTIPTNRKSCPRALCCNSTQCWEELCSGHLALLHQHLQYRDWLYETDVFLLVAFPYLNDVCSVFLSDPGKVYRNKKVKKNHFLVTAGIASRTPPPRTGLSGG